jgi:hypothetical protein
MGGPLGSSGDDIAYKWVGARVRVVGTSPKPDPTKEPVPRGRWTPDTNTASGDGSTVAGVTGGVAGSLQGSEDGFPVAGSGTGITDTPNIYLAIAGGLIVGGATLVLAGRARERRMRRRA